METTTSAFMEHARILGETEHLFRKTANAGDTAARRKAANLFYDYVSLHGTLSKTVTRQLVRRNERFGTHQSRPEFKKLFRIGEIAALTGKSGEIVQAAIELKRADPAMTRDELLASIEDL
ncbi:hypothetical protein P9281_02810 [Caballeronia sp. LP003]|uniref:hypothetical protein n=1 Tax=Caballeronia sp. LP003 TaxID=3038551 RepID=UPI00285F974D|nr:hypothetical protein [Caballeronia sp. LP003]MDR5785481.1 hypothetical protein [Caballeronia sp. LP003]